MRFIHRVSKSSSPEVAAELAELGIEVASAGLVTFEVDESDGRWQELQEWTIRRDAFDWPTTKFSEAELASASWLSLTPDWHHGYPQPREDSFGFRGATYDLSEYCEHCGRGLRQIAPFQMKREPKWGRRSILQLNWVFDEFFVTPQVWSAVFAPFGIPCRGVVTPRGIELDTVVQLVVGERVDVATEGLVAEACDACGRVKYQSPQRGMSPALMSHPVEAMVKTAQWFGGGGASSHREVLVDQHVRIAMIDAGVRGASFRPLVESPEVIL